MSNATVTPPGLTTTSFTSSPVSVSTSTNPPSTTIQTTTASTQGVSQSPSTTSFAPPSSTSQPPPATPTTALITSVVTRPASSDGSTSAQATTIVLTSTDSSPAFSPASTSAPSSSSKSSSTSSGAAALATNGVSSTSSRGLTPGGKIAVAVVVPIAVVALLVLGGLFFWRRRKQRKDAEELRRKEVEEYGFNPNNDPTLPAVGGIGSNGEDPAEMRETDGAGYRGWGTTSTARKPSTTLSSANGAIGLARSGSGSDPGYLASSSTAVHGPGSDENSEGPLVGSPNNGRPTTADSETIGALGAAPAASSKRQDRDINRGPSNASSAYSGAHRSDTSGDGVLPGSAPGQQYYNEGIYYDEGMPQHGPYGDGSYGGGQPVIRDVQARRNTRIENPSVFPQQGNAGIAQNF